MSGEGSTANVTPGTGSVNERDVPISWLVESRAGRCCRATRAGDRCTAASDDFPSAGTRHFLQPNPCLTAFFTKTFFPVLSLDVNFQPTASRPAQAVGDRGTLSPHSHWSLLSHPLLWLLRLLERAPWNEVQRVIYSRSPWGATSPWGLDTSTSFWRLRAICLPPAPWKRPILAAAILPH